MGKAQNNNNNSNNSSNNDLKIKTNKIKSSEHIEDNGERTEQNRTMGKHSFL